MTISARYDDVLALMHATPGVSIRDADSKEATARYLERNPGLNFIAEADGSVTAAPCAATTVAGVIYNM